MAGVASKYVTAGSHLIISMQICPLALTALCWIEMIIMLDTAQGTANGQPEKSKTAIAETAFTFQMEKRR